jgi:hypothetical protein
MILAELLCMRPKLVFTPIAHGPAVTTPRLQGSPMSAHEAGAGPSPLKLEMASPHGQDLSTLTFNSRRTQKKFRKFLIRCRVSPSVGEVGPIT